MSSIRGHGSPTRKGRTNLAISRFKYVGRKQRDTSPSYHPTLNDSSCQKAKTHNLLNPSSGRNNYETASLEHNEALAALEKYRGSELRQESGMSVTQTNMSRFRQNTITPSAQNVENGSVRYNSVGRGDPFVAQHAKLRRP